MDAFEVLGVPADASSEQIRAAYRRRAGELHPDRHVRADGTVPPEVHESFCALTRAVEAALAARRFPAQRTPHAARGPARRPARFEDPVLALLTVPRSGDHAWTDAELEFWALTLVPVARRHEAEAVRLACAAGAATVHQQTLAAAHALLTLSLRGRAGARAHRVSSALPAAYSVLEADLPGPLVARLPRPVLTPPSRRLRLFA